jgi:hypothetical protein
MGDRVRSRVGDRDCGLPPALRRHCERGVAVLAMTRGAILAPSRPRRSSQIGLRMSNSLRHHRRKPLLIQITTPAYSFLSMFQNTGVAGPSSTPVKDLRQTLGWRYWPSGM